MPRNSAASETPQIGMAFIPRSENPRNRRLSVIKGGLNGSTQHFISNEEMECMQMTRRNGRGFSSAEKTELWDRCGTQSRETILVHQQIFFCCISEVKQVRAGSEAGPEFFDDRPLYLVVPAWRKPKLSPRQPDRNQLRFRPAHSAPQARPARDGTGPRPMPSPLFHSAEPHLGRIQ